jgi:hypothetical protein
MFGWYTIVCLCHLLLASVTNSKCAQGLIGALGVITSTYLIHYARGGYRRPPSPP